MLASSELHMFYVPLLWYNYICTCRKLLPDRNTGNEGIFVNVHSLLYNPKGVDKEIIYSMTCDGNRPIHNIQVTYTLGTAV